MPEPDFDPWWTARQLVGWIYTRNTRLLNAERDPKAPTPRYFALEERRGPDDALELEAVPIGGTTDKKPDPAAERKALSRRERALVRLAEIRAEHPADADYPDAEAIDRLTLWGRPGAEFGTPEEATAEAIMALQDGRLTAWARCHGTGPREAIEAVEWADLRFWIWRDQTVAIAAAGDPPEPIPQAVIWYDLRFSRDEAFKLWPAPDRARGSNRAKTDCRRWLEELMAGDSEPRKAKGELYQQALNSFPGLSQRSFNEAWADAIENTGNRRWSRPGRRA